MARRADRVGAHCLARPVALVALRALAEAEAPRRPTPVEVQLDEPDPTARVLVADDDPVSRLVAVKMIEKLGLRCDAVTDGQEAVERLALGHYDLALLDLHMPRVGGVEAAERIRLGEDEHRTALVAMTASTVDDTQDRVVDAGMDALLRKPVDFERVRDVVRRFLPA